jgi:hypothetical protein
MLHCIFHLAEHYQKGLHFLRIRPNLTHKCRMIALHRSFLAVVILVGYSALGQLAPPEVAVGLQCSSVDRHTMVRQAEPVRDGVEVQNGVCSTTLAHEHTCCESKKTYICCWARHEGDHQTPHMPWKALYCSSHFLSNINRLGSAFSPQGSSQCSEVSCARHDSIFCMAWCSIEASGRVFVKQTMEHDSQALYA